VKPKPRSWKREWLPFIFCLLYLTAAAADKPIRLRNEQITPSASAAGSTVAAADQNPASGLFLVQFTGAVQPAWRDQLNRLGVDLLRYVPDDAFIAKFNGAAPGQVRRLDFVRYVGPYRPEHKVHRDLLPGGKAASETNDVAVLLSPRVTDAEVARAKRSFASISQESSQRTGHVLRGKLNAAQLDTLARSDSVLWIEPSPKMKLLDEVSSKIVAGDGGTHTLLTQSLGYDGAGATVAVADSGIDSGDTNDMHPDIQGRVSALFYYGSPGQLDGAQDEHGHGTHVSGIIAGNGAVGETDENNFLYGLGVAPGSKLIGQRIFDGDGNFAPPPSFEKMTRDARRSGAEIGSNSWGDDTQGRYDISAMEFDGLVRDADALALGDQPYILEFSAGNAGPAYQTVGSPAVAKNVIATGAANSDRENLPFPDFAIYDDGPDSMTDFSSRGPCEDGRIKPDVVAPGSWIASLRSVFANDDFAWWPISDNYFYMGGTSQAGPHVSGAAAVFVQFYRATHSGATPSPALVKAALINSATDMDDSFGTGPVPNMDEGWGRVNLPALIGSPLNYEFLDQSVLLTNGAVYEERILIVSTNAPLKVTLAYTDVPGNPAAVIALVNDLDLEVQSPDGHLYRGNQFADGESLPDPPGVDNINNVEAVHLLAPVPGEYIIRVRATHVVDDARQDTLATDQDFALVVSGLNAAPGEGIVTFDRPVYRAPDLIRLTLVDYDLAGQPGANILLRSTDEPLGETIALKANGSTGLFTGAVATATGPAVPDQKLEVVHNDVIEAVYADASPASNRVFRARADLVPPVISNVGATNQFGQIVVSWITDEDADSTVYYGTNTLNLTVSDSSLQTSHELTLENIAPQSVQKFMIVSQDAAGNRSTNNNGGLYFTITNTQPPDVLLLDSFGEYLGLLDPPPLSGYTDALNTVGATYDVFDATTGAEPSLVQLKAYRCVIWRVSDLDDPSPTLAQKITDYVQGGGSLFLASMEALSRFTEVGLTNFTTGVLRVQSFTADQPVDTIVGVSGDPVGVGINVDLDYTPYADILAVAGTTDPSDWIVPNPNFASGTIQSDPAIVGLRAPKTGVDLPGRVVFLSFPFDAVPLGTGIGNNRSGLLRNVLNLLAPSPGSSSLTLDSDVYSVPGRAVAEVEDLDLKGQGTTSINVHSPQHGNQISVTLTETVRQGLFRGSFIFLPTNSGVPGSLFVQNGDTVQVDYLDASSGQTISATVGIQTNAPAITNVSIEPGYLEAQVSWQTSEAADSLVQYSESPDSFPKNLTAYDPGMTTDHQILLTGLKPNQNYWARVVSRDRAGNTTIDDNGGVFYPFKTLQPRVPPWFDDIETPDVEWSTFTSDGSDTGWTRGSPGGGETAHSPTNCWGSNLSGGPVGAEESFLISPGILLTGGNQATLHFWHNYDFTPQSDGDIEIGTIEIITNVADPSQLLRQLPSESLTGGWTNMDIDLTPYMGQVVYIVWYYFLFSADDLPRMGWLVDDVSITVTNVQYGTIQITNNLWQAVFSLSGTAGFTGNGANTILSNMPSGPYTIDFGDALYYHTPASQSNTLAPGGTLVFHGNYTFDDVNSNGIPDAWEMQTFGRVDPQRTRTTDTDHDGMSDWAEFVAGTDPNNPPPPFAVTASRLGNGSVQFSWPSISNHTYRVLASADLFSWSDYSGWLTATGTNLTLTVPPTNGVRSFFRVEAAVPSGPNFPAPFLRVNAVRQPNGAMRLDWPSASGHGYRVWGSTNFVNWTPISDWIRASSATSSFTNAAGANAGSQFFRIEAAP
jgi:subtilisin family serine protease